MIACYGEALVDLFVSPFAQGHLLTNARACLGGSVFNFCLAAQRQGMPSVYLNALSMDGFGRQFERLLRCEGVIVDARPCVEPTSLAIVELDAQASASYAFHRTGVADLARDAGDIIANWPAQVTALHTGCLMLTPPAWEQTKRILKHAERAACLLSVDANLRLSVERDHPRYIAHVREACAAAHVVKVSDDDLRAMHGLPANQQFDESAYLAMARQVLNQGARTALVALTLGERGAWLITRGLELCERPVSNMAVVDTVGAGDTFIAALLAHLRRQGVLHVSAAQKGWPQSALQRALSHAIGAAQICVGRIGCDPPSWEQTMLHLQRSAKPS